MEIVGRILAKVVGKELDAKELEMVSGGYENPCWRSDRVLSIDSTGEGYVLCDDPD